VPVAGIRGQDGASDDARSISPVSWPVAGGPPQSLASGFTFQSVLSVEQDLSRQRKISSPVRRL
jgi:hypothetical protein